MARFRFVAKDVTGRSINELAEAVDQAALLTSLRKRNLTVITVVPEREKATGMMSYRRIKADDIVIFSRQLATLVETGIPLVQGLEILGEQMENKDFAEIIRKIKGDIESGKNLSEAFAQHPKVFSTLFVHMVKAGETSGTLDEILDRMAAHLEKTESLRRKIKSALTYPAVVTLMAIAITLLLLIKVIPVFEEIFSSFGAKLPLPTLILIAVSKILRKYFLLGLIILVLGIYTLKRYVNTEQGRLAADRLKLRLPVFGVIFRKIAIGKFSRTLSTLVRSGVPILSSLEIVERTSGNRVIEMAVEKARNRVREGESIAAPLAGSGVFPPMVTRMIAVGEKTGELEKMLSKISEFYEEQVDATVSGLTSLIEPLIIAFLGIVIGTIVICMFLPIFKLSQIVTM